MKETTQRVRLAGTALLFALALLLFIVASVTHRAWPLFVAWAPLIAVPWLLTRPEAGQTEPDRTEVDSGAAQEPGEVAPAAEDESAGG